MTTVQFIDSTVGLVVRGKKQNTKMISRLSSAPVSTVDDHWPRLQRAGGSVSPRHRFQRTHPVEAMYELSNDAVPSDMIALNATEEPRLISDKRLTMTRLVQSAFNGTKNRG